MKGIENFDPQNLQVVIGQEPASKIKHTRYLRIEVDEFRSWEEHISALIKKTSRGIGMLCNGKRYLPLTTFSQCIEALLNHISDSAVRRGESAVNKLQKLQNRAARIATNSPYDAPPQPLRKKLGWQTIREFIDMETATMIIGHLKSHK